MELLAQLLELAGHFQLEVEGCRRRCCQALVKECRSLQAFGFPSLEALASVMELMKASLSSCFSSCGILSHVKTSPTLPEFGIQAQTLAKFTLYIRTYLSTQRTSQGHETERRKRRRVVNLSMAC